MKKILAVLLAVGLVLSMAACAGAGEKKGEGVMTYAQFVAAEVDSEVTIEAYVQGKQSWWDNKATVYLQDKEGGYLAYNMTCSEEDYLKLTTGTKIRAKGVKGEWAGEVELQEGATFEILSGNYVAKAEDVTALLGTDKLAEKMNRLVAMKGLEVLPQEDGAAFNYKNAEEKTDDLYVKVKAGDAEVNLCVEFYLTGKDTDVYKAVEGLKVGDKIDVEGFLYWYNGPNPHLTKVTVK